MDRITRANCDTYIANGNNPQTALGAPASVVSGLLLYEWLAYQANLQSLIDDILQAIGLGNGGN